MRRLAADLGVEAASLYKHVTNKDDLHAGVAELVWEEVAVAAPPSADWATWLRSYGNAVRDAIHRHPNALALWITQPVCPLPALELFDAQLGYCQPDCRDQGANVLHVVGAFAIGYATTELAWYAAPTTELPESEAQRVGRIARALPANAPDRLIDVALLVCTGDTTGIFETGLNLMIKGLDLP